MTSHEMRNPLSAIIQCSDWIQTSLAEYRGDSKNINLPREAVDGYLDAAQTIALCSQHQKRIIDDILTLSKLDSDLLLITPVEVRPVSVLQSSLKMFESEVHSSDMELRFKVDPSYTELAVDVSISRTTTSSFLASMFSHVSTQLTTPVGNARPQPAPPSPHQPHHQRHQIHAIGNKTQDHHHPLRLPRPPHRPQRRRVPSPQFLP